MSQKGLHGTQHVIFRMGNSGRGEIAAVSPAHGGPPPCFPKPRVFESIVTDVDMTDIKAIELTKTENNILQGIQSDCKASADLILEHGYTGVIDDCHNEEINQWLAIQYTCTSHETPHTGSHGTQCH